MSSRSVATGFTTFLDRCARIKQAASASSTCLAATFDVFEQKRQAQGRHAGACPYRLSCLQGSPLVAAKVFIVTEAAAAGDRRSQ